MDNLKISTSKMDYGQVEKKHKKKHCPMLNPGLLLFLAPIRAEQPIRAK